jgi:hypothetical protein
MACFFRRLFRQRCLRPRQFGRLGERDGRCERGDNNYRAERIRGMKTMLARIICRGEFAANADVPFA